MPKNCMRCGRAIAWRRKWARCWDSVKYCSDACRRRGISRTDAALEAAIVSLLEQRAGGATICPSEAARLVGGAGDDRWRQLMEPAREAGRRLAAQGLVEFTQHGRVVDPSRARGPVRLRLRPGSSPSSTRAFGQDPRSAKTQS
jgi:hypothetical protein